MRKVALDSAVVTILNVTSQAASFILFAGIAALFGANWQTDAFFLAMTVPALVIASVMNAITSVFIPVMTECRVQRPRALGELIGSALRYVFALSVLAAAAMGLAAAPLLMWANPGLGAESRRLAVQQTLLLLPMIATQTVTAVLAAAYNSMGRFWFPTGTSTLRFLATLVLILVLRPALGITSLPASFVLGTLIQVVLLGVFWPRLGIRVILRWRVDSDLAQSFKLALPLIMGTAALQLGVVVSRFLASRLPAGSVSMLDYASRISSGLMELLTGGVLLVTLADWSQVAAQGDVAALQAKLRQTTRLGLFALLPIVAVLLALREPVIAVALQRGQFTAGLATTTAGVLAFYLIGIPLDAVGRVYVRLFLVWRNTVVVGGLAVFRLVATAIMSLVLMRALGVRGLALADSIAVTLITSSLIVLADRKLGSTLSGLGLALAKLGLAAVMAGLVAGFLNHAVPGSSPWIRLPVVGGLSIAAYLGTAWILQVKELGTIYELFVRRQPEPAT